MAALNYGTTTYGLPTLTVSATPRWNVQKALRGRYFVPKSGPNGEDGFLLAWEMRVYAQGSRKGLEALKGPYVINDDFTSTNFPNVRFVDWRVNPTGWNTNADLSSTGQNGCGDWRNQLSAMGTTLDYMGSGVADLGVTNNSTVVYQVARGGTCDATVVDNVNKLAVLTLDNTDFSLAFYPTKNGSFSSAATLVDTANFDASTNQWWVAHKSTAT